MIILVICNNDDYYHWFSLIVIINNIYTVCRIITKASFAGLSYLDILNF